MAKKYESYGGEGFGGNKENAHYMVRYGNDEEDKRKHFGKFSEAKKFYDSLTCDKFFWDCDHHELIDGCHWVEKNEGKGGFFDDETEDLPDF